MNIEQHKGDWKVISKRLKQRWPELTDTDLEYTEGAEEALFTHIQNRTHAMRHDVEHVIAKASAESTSKS
jgi:uncharacterized protein YjbJ (UPF0337 family)